MKILFLSRRFYPDIGGVEKHVLELSKILTGKGHSVTVLTESQGTEKEPKGINVVRMPIFPGGWFKKLYIWRWIFVNRKIFDSAEIIHAHDVYFWYFPLKILDPFKKSYITFHGYESYPVSLKAILIRKTSEVLSSGNICIGAFMRKWYLANPTKVIYGAVNTKKIKNKRNNYSAVFIGRLDDQTGVVEYVKAIERIRKKYPKFAFKIIGDGKYFLKLKKYEPTGFIKEPESYLGGYHFAFVSRYLSILEALVSKKPVIALYDNPIKKDYLFMSPFAQYIFIENSAEDVSKRVIDILDHKKEISGIVEKGYKWARTMTWKKVCEDYLDLWKM